VKNRFKEQVILHKKKYLEYSLRFYKKSLLFSYISKGFVSNILKKSPIIQQFVAIRSTRSLLSKYKNHQEIDI
jgi:hypothetical protein